MNKLLIYLTILFLVFSLCDVVEAITSTEEDVLCVSKKVEDFFNRNNHLIEPSVGNLLDLNTVNIYPTDYDGILPEQIVSYEISNDRPIYMGMKNYGDRDGWHAFVLRGYNFATNTYSIWNPWYREYAEISIYSKSISYGNDIYIWGDSIYEWR